MAESETHDDDPRVTSKHRLIQLHYERNREDFDWSPARFRRLAGAMGLTIYELGAFVRIKPTQTEQYLHKGKFPATVELHLTLIERTLLPSSKPPVFPYIPC